MPSIWNIAGDVEKLVDLETRDGHLLESIERSLRSIAHNVQQIVGPQAPSSPVRFVLLRIENMIGIYTANLPAYVHDENTALATRGELTVIVNGTDREPLPFTMD